MAFDIRFLTLSTVIDRYPGWVSVLEQFGIDGRAGVEVMLGAAADRAGVDVETLAISLASPQPSRWGCDNIAEAPVRALLEHIEGVHHGLLWREFPRLAELIESVRSSHPDDAALVALSESFAALRHDLEQHLRLEEASLFPICHRIVDAYSWPSSYTGPLDHPIDELRHDHDHAHDLLVDLHTMLDAIAESSGTGGADNEIVELIAGVGALQSDLGTHLAEENDVLFPKVIALVRELNAS